MTRGLIRPSLYLVVWCVSLSAQPPITWHPSQYTISLQQGVTTHTVLSFTSLIPLQDVSLFVTPELSQFLSFPTAPLLTTLPSGARTTLFTWLHIPSSTAPGLYDGTVHVRAGRSTVPHTLPLVIHVIPPSSTHIPVGPTLPSSDRLITTSTGIPAVVDELIVGLHLSLRNSDQIAIHLAIATNAFIIGSIPDTNTYQFRYPRTTFAGLTNARSTLQASPYVSFAVHHLFTASSKLPNDPLFKQWDILGIDQWGPYYISAPSAWDYSTGSTSVVVGVIDHDFDTGHPDLRPNITTPLPLLSNAFSSGHGTHVAGIIGAATNNNTGIAGILWGTTLKLYDCSHPDDKDQMSTYCIAGSMLLAAREGVRIANLSTSAPGAQCGKNPPADEAAMQTAKDVEALFGRSITSVSERLEKDVLWVFAAGNGCRDAKYESSPRLANSFSNVMAVSAIARGGSLATFSNTGAVCGATAAIDGCIDVAAPGVNIYSTVPRWCKYGLDVLCSYNLRYLDLYGSMDGTSMAAPHVTGVAALVLSKHPDLTAAETRRCVVDSARAYGARVPNHHRVSVLNAVEAVKCEMGRVVVLATLDSVTWPTSGTPALGYSVTGPGEIGDVLADTPTPASKMPTIHGPYSLRYTGGGPPNSTFLGISPCPITSPPSTSCTQTLNANQTLTFTLRFTTINQPPTAGFVMSSGSQAASNGQTLNVTVPPGGSATVSFDGSAPRSYDPDGTVVAWDWVILNAPGTTTGVRMTQSVFSRTFTVGTYPVTLVVTDNRGAQSAPATGTIVVTEAGPSGTADAAADFSITNNPNGSWSYGSTSTLGGTFTRFTTKDPNQAGVSGMDVWSFGPQCSEPCPPGYLVPPFVIGNSSSVTIGSQFGFDLPPRSQPPYLLLLHPDKGGFHPPFRYSVVRWTAPEAGIYTVSGLFKNSDTVVGATTDVHVLLNSTELLQPSEQRISGLAAQVSFTRTVGMFSGNTIDFVVGDGGNFQAHDATGLSVTITKN